MIVGQMSLFRFPMWNECLKSLASHVDALYLRFDGLVGDKFLLENAENYCYGKLKDVFISKKPWTVSNWREEMLRMLDNVKPEIVINTDEDEKFGEGIREDIMRFRKSSSQQMAFNYQYPMPSVDGFVYKDKPLPSKPHVKMYKWRKGLTFLPYKRRGRLSNYGSLDFKLGKSEIKHYCFYNKEIRAIKLINTKAKIEWLKEQ